MNFINNFCFAYPLPPGRSSFGPSFWPQPHGIGTALQILPELDQVARACSLELGNEQLYLQQRQLNRRADILRQRLVLLTRAYQTSSSQTVPSTLNRSFEQQRATAPPPPQPPLEQVCICRLHNHVPA